MTERPSRYPHKVSHSVDTHNARTTMPTVMDRPKTLSPKQVGDVLGMSRRTIYRWISDGELETLQPTGKPKSRHRIFERHLAEKIGEEEAAEVFDAYATEEET